MGCIGSRTAAETVGRYLTNGGVALVTGGNTGLGYETVRALYRSGARVIIASRDLGRVEAAIARLYEEEGRDGAPVRKPSDGQRALGALFAEQVDMSDLASVRALARRFEERDWPLHALVLNAGALAMPYRATADGYDACTTLNFLSNALLTRLLFARLRATPDSRVVFVGTRLHEVADAKFIEKHPDLIVHESEYSAFTAYNEAKLLLAQFARELHRREAAAAANDANRRRAVSVFYLHPGVVATDVGRDSKFVKLIACVLSPFLKSIEQGAATTVFCASQEDIGALSGSYFKNAKPVAFLRNTSNAQLNARVWEATARAANLPVEHV